MLLRELYAIQSDEPFLNLTVERMKKHFEFGQASAGEFATLPRNTEAEISAFRVRRPNDTDFQIRNFRGQPP